MSEIPATQPVEASISLRPVRMTVVTQTEDRRFLVSEEQLDLLCKRSKDSSLDWCLFMAGGALGFVQNFASLVGALLKPEVPTAWDAVGAILFAACAAGAIAKFTQHRHTSHDRDGYLKKMKAGREVSVS